MRPFMGSAGSPAHGLPTGRPEALWTAPRPSGSHRMYIPPQEQQNDANFYGPPTQVLRGDFPQSGAEIRPSSGLPLDACAPHGGTEMPSALSGPCPEMWQQQDAICQTPMERVVCVQNQVSIPQSPIDQPRALNHTPMVHLDMGMHGTGCA